MKINGIGGPGYVSGANKINKVSAADKYRSTQSGDKVAISDEAMNFSKVFAAAKQEAGAREVDVKARIDTIREQIENGTYNVSSDELADSILGELYF